MRSLQAPRIGVAYGIWERLTRLRDLWPVSPVLFRRLALLTAFLMGAIIVSGGAVRLTGSGLGCPDWPNCFKHEYVAPLAFHPLVEFANRVFTVALSVSVGVTTLAALLRRPWRRDLALLSGGLLLGIIGQIILGGLVVIFKLYPPLVMIHFVFSIAIVVDAVVLH
ncbi:MAG: COX15/CtaA family protein, partial [Acidimicrobiales bacterium]